MQTLDLHAKNSDFKPTAEELRTIQEKMKDPEFMKLWAEYAETLNDPKHRAEEEEYLRQIEAEAREGGDYSFDFIFPRPIFAVMILNDGRRQSTFINVCDSDKVESFSEDRMTASNDASWHVPVVVGKPHTETFESRQVTVYDCVFHPKTVELANLSNKFMCFLIEIAIENINGGYNQSFGFEFRRMAEKSIGEPKNQTIRRKGAEPMFPKDQGPVSKGPVRAAPAPAAPSKTKAAAPSSNTDATFSIAHRGEIDLTDAWNWKSTDKRIGVPRELVVKFVLPKVDKASELEVEVVGHSVVLSATSANYSLRVPLPFSVEQDPVTAKFDRTRHELALVLRVIPPPRPECHVQPEGSAPEPEELADAPEPDGQPEVNNVQDAKAGPASLAAQPAPSLTQSVPSSEAQDDNRSRALADVMAMVEEARKRREDLSPAGEMQSSPTPEDAPSTSAPAAPTERAPLIESVDLRGKLGPVLMTEDEPPKVDDKTLLEAQKRLRAERESERAAAELSKKMAELPLCSRHIFALD